DGDDQQFGLEGGAVFQRHDDDVLVLRDALEPNAQRVVDAALAVGTLELLADRYILVRDQVRQCYDDGDVGAPRLPDAGVLDADDAAAQHGDLLRNEVQVEGLLGGDHAAADLQTRQRAGVGAGRQHDVLAGDAGAGNFDLGRGDELAFALEHGDAAHLDQTGQALELAGDDLLAV